MRWLIKDWRQYRGLTQAQLADRLGISQATLSRYEAGMIQGIPYVHVLELSHVLDVPTDKLCEKDDADGRGRGGETRQELTHESPP